MTTSMADEATVASRVSRLRDVLAAASVKALVVPSSDPHLSEYLPEHWQGRRYLSGFKGSVGTLVVTAEFAGLWVDSRYWEQAERELAGTPVAWMKLLPGQPGPFEWVAGHVAPGDVVAVDGAVLALTAARDLRSKLEAVGAALSTDTDWLAEVWDGRPGLPAEPVYSHSPQLAAESVESKLARLRGAMMEQQAGAHFIATLDDIAWLFNLRGSDVSYNPVFLAFALITASEATLFVSAGKIPPALASDLAASGVQLADYAAVSNALRSLKPDTGLLVDPAKVTVGVLQNVANDVRLVEALNPSTLFKSRKGEAQAEHVRAAMEDDGAALCEFFAWLEAALPGGAVTELDVDDHITAARARRPGFICPSFATIAAFNANGALPHYRATDAHHSVIEGEGLLLIDSGGQYVGGTTDITRMVPVGVPNQAQREDCTRVLKGMIALSMARFPKGIASPLLDAIARAPIWADLVNYGHGTGHGVGYFLNVHEGPQVIAYQAAPAPQTSMLPGMITSIEPGTYRPGRWGVRIENLALSREAGATEFGEFLEFETLTLCPIDTRCVFPELLSAAEKLWLNDYHQEVRARLSGYLTGPALAWLEARTQPV